MNLVVLSGRLTKDPEVSYSAGSQMAVASFTLAIDRPGRQGQDRQTDFPRVKVFGKTAKVCEKYLAKGMKVTVQARVQTGSFQNKQGKTIYTTDIVAERVELPDRMQAQPSAPARREPEQKPVARQEEQKSLFDEFPGDFEQIEEDLPF